VVPALAARARCVQAHCVRWWAPADEVLPRRRPGAGGAGRADAPAAPRQAQKTTRLCIARDLTEADVVARIMRKENYLIGLLNRGVLALHVPVPGLRKRLMLTKTLEWNLQWCARARARRARGQPYMSPSECAAAATPAATGGAARGRLSACAHPGVWWVSDACHRGSGVCQTGTRRPSGGPLRWRRRCVLDAMLDEKSFRIREPFVDDVAGLQRRFRCGPARPPAAQPPAALAAFSPRMSGSMLAPARRLCAGALAARLDAGACMRRAPGLLLRAHEGGRLSIVLPVRPTC